MVDCYHCRTPLKVQTRCYETEDGDTDVESWLVCTECGADYG